MIVERIWTGNAYRNYNYLIACPENGEALAIDPLDHQKCLAAASIAARTSASIVRVQALSLSGRLSVMVATRSRVL